MNKKCTNLARQKFLSFIFKSISLLACNSFQTKAAPNIFFTIFGVITGKKLLIHPCTCNLRSKLCRMMCNCC